MRIPILDLSDEMKVHGEEFIDAARDIILSTQFILGKNVQAFEKEMAAYLGVKHAVSCNSGTDALIIGLRALDVGPGDEVIVPSFTFFATAEAVSLVGAKPVFVDIDPVTYCLKIDEVESSITTATKAVIPVHLFGHAADTRKLSALARSRGIAVLEDTAQATGAESEGRKLGSFGEAGAFSFFPSKNLGAMGDGGMMTTNDDSIADKMRMLRVHGSRKRYHNEMVGYCSRLDELQAAFLRIKLGYLDSSNQGRRSAATRYREMLGDIAGVTVPSEAPGTSHVFHQYTIRVPAEKRDTVHTRLAEAGIGTMIYYPIPVHQCPVYAQQAHRPLPETERAAREVLSLPIWPTLSADTQWEVAAALRSALA
jgi:dTDP-4-amino-4,6-dideoxygalactose transaminase